ncbi:MAG: O-antigen ligase family protein [Thermoguttaceae bacterium]
MRRLISFLLCLIAFTIPWEEFVQIPQIGTVARLIAYVALGLVPFAFLFSPRIRPLKGIHLMMGGFLLWSGVTLLWTVDEAMTLERVGIYARSVGLAWMFWEYTATLKSQHRVMQAFLCGGLFAIGNQFWSFVSARGFDDSIARVTGGKLNANDLAYVLVASIVFALYLAADPKVSRKLRFIYWGYAALASVSVLLTASRMGVILLAFCFAYFFLWLLRRNATAAFMLLVFMGVSLTGAVMWFLPKEGMQRLLKTHESLSVDAGDSDRLGGRMAIWESAAILAKRKPIVGYGAGVFEIVIKREFHHPRTVTAHNSYISIQVGMGIIGLFFFAGVQAFALKYAWGLPKIERSVWLLLLVLLYISSTVLGLEHSKTIWMTMGLVTSHAETVARQLAAAARLPRRNRCPI